MIGLPELARPTARYQYLYLNGRHIRDRFVQHALRGAYRGLTEPGRHPAAILLLEVPPGDVDVNVHPTKSEVRFRDGGRIHWVVLSTIREKLLGSDLTPSAVPFRSDARDELPRQDLREKLAAFFKQQLPGGNGATANEYQAEVFTPAPGTPGEGRGEGARESGGSSLREDRAPGLQARPHPVPL